MTSVTLLIPAPSPGSASVTSISQPRDSAQRWYIRRSMFAQSRASVPPAPALMLRMQLLLSCGPLRKTRSSSASSSLKNLARSGSSSLLDFRLRRGRLGFAELDHHPEIVELFFGFEQRLDLVAEGIGLVNEFLGLLAVVPEIVRRHQGVEFAQPFLRAGHVKETSADA